MAHPQNWGAPRTKKVAWTITKVCETAKINQAKLIDKVHLLHETTLSRLGEVAVLSNVKNSKESQGKWRNRGIYPKQKDKIKLQKQTLMKWRYLVESLK